MVLGDTNSVLLSTLMGHTRFLAGTLNNTSQFTDAQIKALLNQAQKNLQALILRKMKFGFEDNGTAGSGNGAISLVAGTNAYAFPTGMLTVEDVSINYTGETNGYSKARPYPKELIDESLNNTSDYNALKGSELSPLYWCFNQKIYIDPVPDTAVAAGLKIWYTSTVTDLSASTSEPVFVEFAGEIICYESAMKYKLAKGMADEAREIERRKLELENAVIEFYCNRDQTTQQRLSVKINNFK